VVNFFTRVTFRFGTLSKPNLLQLKGVRVRVGAWWGILMDLPFMSVVFWEQ